MKTKQSVAFFISFDGDDGKATFKIPKRFLKHTESTREASKKHHINENNEVLNMDPIIPDEEDFIESDVEMGYQQFGVQKLQTIHELNENESSNELKTLMDKSDDTANKCEDKEISMIASDKKNNVEHYDKFNEETDDKFENSLRINEGEIKMVKDNETEQSHDVKRKRSAQIIQRAFKNYLARRGQKEVSLLNNEDKCLSNNSEIKLNENLAAARIQKAVRIFLARIAKNAKETESLKDKKYSNAEILAAIRIQKYSGIIFSERSQHTMRIYLRAHLQHP